MHVECRKQGAKCCVVGVPKSIDNDIMLIDRCFGFETAVAEAKKALLAGKVEAVSSYRCTPPSIVDHWMSSDLQSLRDCSALYPENSPNIS